MLINKRFFYIINFSLLHIILRYFEQQHNGHVYEYFTREPEINLSTYLVKFQ